MVTSAPPAALSAGSSGGSRDRSAETARRGARRADRTDAELGQRLWQLRLRRGITRREAAARLGVTAQQIQKYELGQDRLSIGRLVRLASLLETPLPVLIEGLGEAEGPADLSAERARRHAESCALMHSFALIQRPELREMVLTLAARLAALGEAGEPTAIGEFPGLPGLDRRRPPGGSTPPVS